MKEFEFVLDVLSYRGIDPDTATCIEQLHQVIGNSFITLYRSGFSADISRSIEATRFMTGYKGNITAPYMIFVDDDEIFTPGDIAKLLKNLKEGKRLVGGCYPTRTGTRLSSEGENIRMDGTVQKCSWLATGFMGIEKSLLADIRDKLKLPLLHAGTWHECYPFFVYRYGENPITREDAFFSEDYEFCRKVLEIGETPWIDTSIQVGHIGRKIYTCDDVAEYQEQNSSMVLDRHRQDYKKGGSKEKCLTTLT